MPNENVYTEAHGFKFPNGTTIPIEDAEARQDISEIKQSLSDLELDTITLTNQTTTGQGLIITNLNYDGRWISAEVAGGRYASFRPSGANKLVIRLVDDNGDAVSSTTVTVKLYHLGAIS